MLGRDTTGILDKQGCGREQANNFKETKRHEGSLMQQSHGGKGKEIR